VTSLLPAPHLVDIGSARLRCVSAGSGSATVVFFNGLGTPLEEWWPVADRVAARARVVLFDRRTTSAAVQIDEAVTDTDRLLTAMRVAGPLIVVGHSYGGLIARAFAAQHHEQLVGALLVDPSHELLAPSSAQLRIASVAYAAMGMLAASPRTRRLVNRGPLFTAQLPNDVTERIHDFTAARASWRTARAELAGLFDGFASVSASSWPSSVPLLVLTAGRGPEKRVARVVEAHRALVASAANGAQEMVADAGHYVNLDRPDVVADALLSLLPDKPAGTSVS
jgi:pimeloyl-ACP methyl ester carboxylesterase